MNTYDRYTDMAASHSSTYNMALTFFVILMAVALVFALATAFNNQRLEREKHKLDVERKLQSAESYEANARVRITKAEMGTSQAQALTTAVRMGVESELRTVMDDRGVETLAGNEYEYATTPANSNTVNDAGLDVYAEWQDAICRTVEEVEDEDNRLIREALS
ncbi:hypothetical protein [Luteimonas sp. MHLX1A]|uniref:hypothetical protein n=1 Tax=Alterluteimonas muca TaxID=2878684 RepID=UPI001E3B25E6|nr:hypothetical protein [Luteimonas sp. MHLX1A]MCD9046853.1 hypothetical protein [Luteimonas sp. MHLX1A]